MQRSTDRILTTHAGSLARPADLLAMVRAKGRPALRPRGLCSAGAHRRGWPRWWASRWTLA